VAAIATLAGALRTRPWMMDAIRRVSRSPLLRRAVIPKLFGSDLADARMRRLNPSRAMPVAALGSLVECMDEVGAHLEEIDRPALVAHGRNDHTVPYACADEIAARLRGPVERLTLERSFHVITLDVERAELAARVGDFFERRLAASSPQAEGLEVPLSDA
jgi:carboxylesterase